ncbi:hypothetical protein AAMO2058_000347600 [Amorphochlora amoebiformis]
MQRPNQPHGRPGGSDPGSNSNQTQNQYQAQIRMQAMMYQRTQMQSTGYTVQQGYYTQGRGSYPQGRGNYGQARNTYTQGRGVYAAGRYPMMMPQNYYYNPVMIAGRGIGRGRGKVGGMGRMPGVMGMPGFAGMNPNMSPEQLQKQIAAMDKKIAEMKRQMMQTNANQSTKTTAQIQPKTQPNQTPYQPTPASSGIIAKAVPPSVHTKPQMGQAEAPEDKNVSSDVSPTAGEFFQDITSHLESAYGFKKNKPKPKPVEAVGGIPFGAEGMSTTSGQSSNNNSAIQTPRLSAQAAPGMSGVMRPGAMGNMMYNPYMMYGMGMPPQAQAPSGADIEGFLGALPKPSTPGTQQAPKAKVPIPQPKDATDIAMPSIMGFGPPSSSSNEPSPKAKPVVQTQAQHIEKGEKEDEEWGNFEDNDDFGGGGEVEGGGKGEGEAGGGEEKWDTHWEEEAEKDTVTQSPSLPETNKTVEPTKSKVEKQVASELEGGGLSGGLGEMSPNIIGMGSTEGNEIPEDMLAIMGLGEEVTPELPSKPSTILTPSNSNLNANPPKASVEKQKEDDWGGGGDEFEADFGEEAKEDPSAAAEQEAWASFADDETKIKAKTTEKLNVSISPAEPKPSNISGSVSLFDILKGGSTEKVMQPTVMSNVFFGEPEVKLPSQKEAIDSFFSEPKPKPAPEPTEPTEPAEPSPPPSKPSEPSPPPKKPTEPKENTQDDDDWGNDEWADENDTPINGPNTAEVTGMEDDDDNWGFEEEEKAKSNDVPAMSPQTSDPTAKPKEVPPMSSPTPNHTDAEANWGFNDQGDKHGESTGDGTEEEWGFGGGGEEKSGGDEKVEGEKETERKPSEDSSKWGFADAKEGDEKSGIDLGEFGGNFMKKFGDFEGGDIKYEEEKLDSSIPAPSPEPLASPPHLEDSNDVNVNDPDVEYEAGMPVRLTGARTPLEGESTVSVSRTIQTGLFDDLIGEEEKDTPLNAVEMVPPGLKKQNSERMQKLLRLSERDEDENEEIEEKMKSGKLEGSSSMSTNLNSPYGHAAGGLDAFFTTKSLQPKSNDVSVSEPAADEVEEDEGITFGAIDVEDTAASPEEALRMLVRQQRFKEALAVTAHLERKAEVKRLSRQAKAEVANADEDEEEEALDRALSLRKQARTLAKELKAELTGQAGKDWHVPYKTQVKYQESNQDRYEDLKAYAQVAGKGSEFDLRFPNKPDAGDGTDRKRLEAAAASMDEIRQFLQENGVLLRPSSQPPLDRWAITAEFALRNIKDSESFVDKLHTSLSAVTDVNENSADMTVLQKAMAPAVSYIKGICEIGRVMARLDASIQLYTRGISKRGTLRTRKALEDMNPHWDSVASKIESIQKLGFLKEVNIDRKDGIEGLREHFKKGKLCCEFCCLPLSGTPGETNNPNLLLSQLVVKLEDGSLNHATCCNLWTRCCL